MVPPAGFPLLLGALKAKAHLSPSRDDALGDLEAAFGAERYILRYLWALRFQELWTITTEDYLTTSEDAQKRGIC